ncbi:hypothetical protein M413DRAFT_79609 [Hebeloma cylindrosporum]|uniref:Uncharacterized protein n=1 Tax=Hebeloma cylindrosporum TaxID=76867 RepID=A0A0C3BV16_HEBCY|nr:hypothetical protein M413DRAFT_79609 [Hebeloma cylindrosporum h7]
MVVRDVCTRWNYTQSMIERGLEMRQGIDQWVFETGEMSEMRLSRADWSLLEKLNDQLKVSTSRILDIHDLFTKIMPGFH